MDENPYIAPHEESLDRRELSASSQRRYESLGQRFLSAILLLMVLTGPVWVASIAVAFSVGRNTGVASSAVSGAMMVWASATGWLIVRVIRRIRTKGDSRYRP